MDDSTFGAIMNELANSLFCYWAKPSHRSLNFEVATHWRWHSDCCIVYRWGNWDWESILDNTKISEPLKDDPNFGRRKDHKLAAKRKLGPLVRETAFCHRPTSIASEEGGTHTLKNSGNTKRWRTPIRLDNTLKGVFLFVCLS